MSIFIIQGAGKETPPLTAAFPSSTTFAALASQHHRASFVAHGETNLSANISADQIFVIRRYPTGGGQSSSFSTLFAGLTALAANIERGGEALALFSGETTLVARLRVGNEPNIGASATFAGLATFTVAPSRASEMFVRFVAGAAITADAIHSLESVQLAFPVETPDPALVALRSARNSRLAARLLSGETEIAITDFSFSEPADRLGAVLNATLARPITSQLAGEDFTFQIGAEAGGAWVWVTKLALASLASRNHSLTTNNGAPADRVTFSTLDAAGDKTGRAPSRPVVIYDPLVTSMDADPTSLESLRYESGVSVGTDLRAVGGLNLHFVLRALYVVGCGFPALYTNLPNYPVDRVDVSIEAGYDAAARALINAFAPLIYTDTAGALWIVDTALPPPDGAPLPRTLSLSDVRAMEDGLNAGSASRRLILSYRVRSSAGEYFSERLEQEHSESGRYGEAGFTETDIARKVREYRKISEPAIITREVVTETTTTVRAFNGEIRTRIKQQDQYDPQGRKSGHTRTVESVAPQFPTGDLFLFTMREEQQSISYRAHPKRPNEWVVDAAVTYVEGLVLYDEDVEYLSKPFAIPLNDAHRNGFLTGTENQNIRLRPISTKVENFRQRGDGEVELTTIVTDHLSGGIERTDSQTRAGTLSVGGANGGRESRRVLLITDSGLTLNPPPSRKVPAFDAGDVPDAIARAMGVRQLARLADPPRSARVDLPALDLTLHRGSRVELPARDGSLGEYIIVGQTIAGRTESGALVITHSFEARESK